MNRFLSAFELVTSALGRAEVEYVVVGSVAATFWGLLRTTIDIDIILMVPQSGGDELITDLRKSGLYVPIETAREALQSTGSFNVLDTQTSGKVDIFVCDPDDAFETMRLERRVEAQILGTSTWIATAEDIILSKLRWRSTSSSDVQWRDCLEIAAVNDLDVDHLRTWAPVIGVSEDLERLLASGPE